MVACSQYKLVPGVDDSSATADSSPPHSGLSEESRDTTESVPGDPECDAIEVANSGPASYDPTCRRLDSVSWGATLELEASTRSGAITMWAGNPIAVPPPGGGSPRIYFQSFEGDQGDVIGFDVALAVESWYLPKVQHAIKGVAGVCAHSGEECWLAIADLTDDEAEVWMTVADIDPVAWTASDYVAAYLFPGSHDVDHDGTPEFLSDGALLSTAAEVLSKYDVEYFGAYALAVDLDGDDVAEVVNSAGIWRLDGTPLSVWTDTGVEDPTKAFFPGVVRVDGEPVVWASDSYGHFLAGTDGVARWHVPVYHDGQDVYSQNPIALGDATGDGRPDLVGELGNSLLLLDSAGTILWQRDRGMGGTGGCAMADLDADGVYEIVDWGVNGLVIYDGRTGLPLARRDDVSTELWMNPPIVADVDGDGSAEIVVTGHPNDGSTYYNTTLYVFGASKGRWARTRPVWNQLPYDVTSIRDDGTIVSFPFRNWETYNSFRAQPAHDGDKPDLVVAATDACATECTSGGTVRVAVQVSNLGSRGAEAGATVRLLTWTEAGGLREVASARLTDGIPAMASAEGVVLDVPWEDWGDQRVLQVDGDLALECDRVNDRTEVDIPDPCAG